MCSVLALKNREKLFYTIIKQREPARNQVHECVARFICKRFKAMINYLIQKNVSEWRTANRHT